MTQCRSLSYIVRKTDNQIPEPFVLVINKGEINDTEFDITLLGKRRREYGEVFNENMLHLLENFSCPARNPDDPIDEQEPDTGESIGNIFENPTHGQFWFNSSEERLYYYVEEMGSLPARWIPLSLEGDVAGNYGHIADGQQIPKPVSAITNREFDYHECSWVVSPAWTPSIEVDYIVCKTDLEGNVTVKYRPVGSTETNIENLPSGIASYQIIGIRGYDPTERDIITFTPIPPNTATATPTPTNTPTNTPVVFTNTPTNTPVVFTNTPTNTPVVFTNTPTNTPVVFTNTPTNTPVVFTNTPTNTPVIFTNTPTNTPVPATNTPTNTPVPATNTPTNTPVPATNTPTNTPIPATSTPTPTPTPIIGEWVIGTEPIQSGTGTPPWPECPSGPCIVGEDTGGTCAIVSEEPGGGGLTWTAYLFECNLEGPF